MMTLTTTLSRISWMPHLQLVNCEDTKDSLVMGQQQLMKQAGHVKPATAPGGCNLSGIFTSRSCLKYVWSMIGPELHASVTPPL